MDIVINCNEIYLQMVRQAGGAPGPISRTGAMLHIAMFEVINALAAPATQKYESYLNAIACVPEASAQQELAAVYAARRILFTVSNDSKIIPGAKRFDIQTNLEASFATLLADYSDASAAEQTDSRTYGECVADAMIASRQTDGYDDMTPYAPPLTPGQWRPTQVGASPATPNWGKLKPFGQWAPLDKFRPSLPGGYKTMSAVLTSREYAAQVDEVKRMGSHNSTERTPEQTEIGFFWANDLDGTSKPPGQLYTLTTIVAEQRHLSLEENARLFALVAMAMGDAAIVSWDTKYNSSIDLWRPDSAIREANSDGNTGTSQDPSWQPLSRTAPAAGGVPFSPPFPAYTSGHATFGAAHAAAMRVFFGTDNVTFTLTTEDPNAVGVTRTFNSFTLAALENARSRIYLGVHYQWDGDNGFLSGTKVGEYVAENFLKPVAPLTVMTLTSSSESADVEA